MAQKKDITAREKLILTVIDNGISTLTGVAKRLGVGTTMISSSVKRMQQKDLLIKNKKLVLTEEGKRVLEIE